MEPLVETRVLIRPLIHQRHQRYYGLRSIFHSVPTGNDPFPYDVTIDSVVVMPFSDLVASAEGWSRTPRPTSMNARADLKITDITTENIAEFSETCGICLDSVLLQAQVTTLPCHHWYHKQCIEKWLCLNETCPMCRASLDVGYLAEQEDFDRYDP